MIKKIYLVTATIFLLASFSGLALAQTEAIPTTEAIPATEAIPTMDDYIKEMNERFKDQQPLNDDDFKAYFKILPQLNKITDQAGAEKVLKDANVDSLRFEYIASKLPTIISLANPNPNTNEEMLNQMLEQMPATFKPNKDELVLGKKYYDEYLKIFSSFNNTGM